MKTFNVSRFVLIKNGLFVGMSGNVHEGWRSIHQQNFLNDEVTVYRTREEAENSLRFIRPAARGGVEVKQLVVGYK